MPLASLVAILTTTFGVNDLVFWRAQVVCHLKSRRGVLSGSEFLKLRIMHGNFSVFGLYFKWLRYKRKRKLFPAFNELL